MEKYDKHTIQIELTSVEELFIEPDYNPLDPESRSQSGIDELVNQARRLSLKEPLKISLTLSSQPADADIEDQVKNALSHYCMVKIRECGQEIRQIQNQGKRDLVWALWLSFLFFLGAFFVYQLPFLPEFIIYLLSTGFGILAWVVLWPPLDALLYEWRPCRRSQRIYEYIQSAKLIINSTRRD